MKGTSLIKDNVMLNFGFPYSIIFTDFKTSVCACVCVCVCVHACVCACMCLCVCLLLLFLVFVSGEENIS